MKKMRKLLCLALALCLLAACLPLSAAAAVDKVYVTTTLEAPIVGDFPYDHRPKITVSPDTVRVNAGSCYWVKANGGGQYLSNKVFDAGDYQYSFSLYTRPQDVTLADKITVVVDGKPVTVDVSKYNAQHQDMYLNFETPQTYTARTLPRISGSVTLDCGTTSPYPGDTIHAILHGSLAGTDPSKITYRLQYQSGSGWGLIGDAKVGENSIYISSSLKGDTIRASVHIDGYSGYLYSPTVEVSGGPGPTRYGVTVVNGKASKTSAEQGEEVVLQADLRDGYSFTGWKVVSGGVTIGNPSNPLASFIMGTSDVVVEATYKAEDVTVTFDPNGGSGSMPAQTLQKGETLTFPACTFTPPAGKTFDYWAIAGKKNSWFAPGDSMEVIATMTVKANWKDAGAPAGNPFVDVPGGKYYTKAVVWAVSQTPQITSGLDETHFGPDKECTRAQVVTFLWNAAGQPEPTLTTHPFTDVKEGAYYYKAMLWAKENGIVAGTTETTFGPGKPCTRGQVVTFLWRYKNKPNPDGSYNPFTDVTGDEYYYGPVMWAYWETPQVTAGTTATTFTPNKVCTRGQVVTFLWNAAGQP